MGTNMLEIIELAKQSDLMADGEMWFSPTYGNADVHIADLERFAKLVAAKEREACAKIVEVEAMQYAEPVWAFEIVNDIRARGEE